MGEKLATFAEDTAQDLGYGEDELAAGPSWQTAEAIQSLVERTRRWWQEGQKWRPLQVKARRRSWRSGAGREFCGVCFDFVHACRIQTDRPQIGRRHRPFQGIRGS